MIHNAIEWARQKVYLWQSSPIQGKFDETKYPFCIAPLLALDDIDCKTMVLLGPTQSFKTVVLQIATGYRLDIRRKSILAVAQSDEDSKDFAKIKLNPFLERIPSLINSLKDDRSAKTISQWLWPTHELIISGPGENAQQSKSVCYLHTDEAHMWNLAYPGAMASLDNRMGLRWDRQGFHATTAADAGTEIDILYHTGKQNEWHLRCIHCNRLVWPKWEEDAKTYYNGHRVFRWIDSQSESETLDSVRMRCPHCDKETEDSLRNRIDMDEGAAYVTMNPGSDKSYNSYRWNAFAPRWKSWRDLLAVYLKALHSAKLGDIKPYSDWITKQEVRTNMHEFPMMGTVVRGDYAGGEVKVDPDALRTCSFDVQEGMAGEGFHIWGLCEQFDKDGGSKRIAYERLASWDDARAFQLKHGAPDKSTCCDCGARAREVFAYCARFHWLAVKSSDEDQFAHLIMQPGKATQTINLPYSQTRLESPNVGQENRQPIVRGGRVPSGFAISRNWSKPSIYPVLHALKSGETGREFSIPKDINPLYVDQLHAYIPALDVDKKTNSTRKVVWRKIKQADHAFVCSAQSLLMAMIHGFYPTLLDK